MTNPNPIEAKLRSFFSETRSDTDWRVELEGPQSFWLVTALTREGPFLFCGKCGEVLPPTPQCFKVVNGSLLRVCPGAGCPEDRKRGPGLVVPPWF